MQDLFNNFIKYLLRPRTTYSMVAYSDADYYPLPK